MRGGALTYNCWLEVNKHSPGDVLACPGLAEEGVERIVPSSNGLVTGHLTVGLDSMFQTVQFPAGIAHLDSGLADVDTDTFPLKRQEENT